MVRANLEFGTVSADRRRGSGDRGRLLKPWWYSTLSQRTPIDERIMKALSQKEHTQTALIDAVKADMKI